MAAALAKMRMPRTTTTPVDSCAPTPSWSPRKTISAATRTFATKRHDEDLVVEDAVEQGPQAAEHCVQGGDDGDRQVGLQPQRHHRLNQQPGDDAEDQAERGDHGALPAFA